MFWTYRSRVIIPDIMKKLSQSVLVLTFLFIGNALTLAQGPPPPAVPDYTPEGWKEYSFEEDNVRFRFPVKPERVESAIGNSNLLVHSYSRESFMLFNLTVMRRTMVEGLPTEKELLAGAIRGGPDRIANLAPKTLEEKELLVDGHPGKFMKIETNDGLIWRMKCFVVKNTAYVGLAVSKKGDRHGMNWENDFEIPAMAFLDSVRLIKTN